MNVVFDFGGVLFRWQPQEFIGRMLPQHAPDEQRARALVLAFFQGYGGDWAEFDRGRLDAELLAERIARRTGIALAEVQSVIAAIPVELQPMADSVALLHELRDRGHRLFFLSNMPAPYADHLEATHAFLAAFEDGIFSSRVKFIKPEPGIFHEAARRFGIVPRESVFIDDVQSNIVAARSLGWNAVQFLSAEGCREGLAAHGLP